MRGLVQSKQEELKSHAAVAYVMFVAAPPLFMKVRRYGDTWLDEQSLI